MTVNLSEVKKSLRASTSSLDARVQILLCSSPPERPQPAGNSKVNSSKISIRRYEAADLDTLIELFRNSVRRVASRDYTHEQVMAWAPDNIDREATASRNLSRPTWVAEIDGVIAGFTDLEPTGHLDRLYVHSDYQRRGVASTLLTTVEAVAKEQHITRLYSEVSITARPFFERCGFRVIASQTVAVRGQEFTNYRMEKLLDSN